MTRQKNFLCTASLSVMLGLCQSAMPAKAETVLDVAPVLIEAPAITYPATSILKGDEIQGGMSRPHADGGDLLSQISGVSAGRFGGHGIEPVIRGLSQNQLNIQNGDSYTFGACPNRMDTPAAYLRVQPQDEVTIVRGYQSVLNGFGGNGGAVIVQQKAPDFGDAALRGDTVAAFGELQGGYDGNSNMRYGNGYITAGSEEAYVSANASVKAADNYKDGGGNAVRAAFDERAGGFKLGLTPENHHIYAAIDYHEIEDALFPGAGMDSPYSENLTFKTGWETRFDDGALERLKISGYASMVDHRMDNFSLRPQTAAMALRVDSESDTYGAKIDADMVMGDIPVSGLLEWRRNNRNADRIVDMTGVLQSLLWPDVTIDEVALAAEHTHNLTERTYLTFGGRYDFVHVDYGRANVAAPGIGGRTANDIYNQFYGYDASNQTEHNFGGVLRLEHDYSDETLLYTGLSRSVRTADATERGLANYMGAGGAMSWVGNPHIKPEKHHQFEVGFEHNKTGLNIGGSAYANIVQDYILRDSARTQDGINVNFPNADIYRNIDALLAGVELRSGWQISPEWRLDADATYTYGQDIEAGHALPQIPPLQGALKLRYSGFKYMRFDTAMRWALRQNRVDTDANTATGRDVGKTDGYAVFDVSATTDYLEPLSLTLGVNNVFDKRYASHLNRSNISDPTEIQVNEPGRSFYLQLKIPF